MDEYVKLSDVVRICEEYAELCHESRDYRGEEMAEQILEDVVNLPVADIK